MRRMRQKTLNLKITDQADAIIGALQLALTAKMRRPVTKTDVIEFALNVLAAREKVDTKAS
jgi:hypothetical protein